MNKGKTYLAGALALAAGLTIAASPALAESTLRAVAPWSKNHPLTKSFLGFIDTVNAKGKGTVQIKFLGGPSAFRNGIR